MKRQLPMTFGILMVALGGGADCADLLGADFDVHARSNNSLDGGRDYVVDERDAGHQFDRADIAEVAPTGDVDVRDVIEADRAPDVDDGQSADTHPSSDGGGSGDAGPDGPRVPTLVGGFVSLAAPNRASSAIELRGHIISNAAIRGVTSTGISIEGRIQ
jgi:hypothetical protein